MARLVLSEARLHNGTKNQVCEFHRNTVEEVAREVDSLLQKSPQTAR